jgi:hypothetical protein
MCRHCGKYGHKAGDCWVKDLTKKPQNGGGGYGSGNGNSTHNGTSGNPGRNNNGGRRFNSKCHYCQKDGHQIKDCHKKKRDEGNDTAATATSGNNNHLNNSN